MDGLLVVDKPAGPTSHDVVARRAPRAAASGASATPARSIRWRPACCRWSSAARPGWRIPERAATRRTRRSIRLGVRDRHRRRAGRGRSARRPAGALPSRDAIDARARRVPRHVPAAAAGVFGEEDRRAAQLQAGARRRAATRRAAAGACRRPTSPTCRARRPAAPVRVTAHAHRDPERRRRRRDAARATAPPASTSARWRTISASGSASARTWRRCGARAAATSALDRRRRRSTRSSAIRRGRDGRAGPAGAACCRTCRRSS